MGLFETIEVDNDKLKSIALKYWGVELGKCLKSSQNHTFLVSKINDNTKESENFILRVTPDPKKERIESTKLEVKLLNYLNDNKLPVCPTIANLVDGEGMVVIDDLIICLFKYATGESINYVEWKWLENQEMAIGLGRWFGELHKLTRSFVKEYPEMLKKARHWQTLHSGVLKGVPVNQLDIESSKDPNQFTIIHGDVNPSNYHWDASIGMPSMFDWDQLQESWLLYDLSAPIWGVVSLEKFGMGGPVPLANPKQYIDLLLQGYEPTIGEKVDRDALDRMIEIRRQLYIRFCKAAVIELADKPDSPMYLFCKRMTDNFENEEREQLEKEKENK
ncbi:hypothetical protein ACTFIW_008480 [Dictyostelium discoideum]